MSKKSFDLKKSPYFKLPQNLIKIVTPLPSSFAEHKEKVGTIDIDGEIFGEILNHLKGSPIFKLDSKNLLMLHNFQVGCRLRCLNPDELLFYLTFVLYNFLRVGKQFERFREFISIIDDFEMAIKGLAGLRARTENDKDKKDFDEARKIIRKHSLKTLKKMLPSVNTLDRDELVASLYSVFKERANINKGNIYLCINQILKHFGLIGIKVKADTIRTGHDRAAKRPKEKTGLFDSLTPILYKILPNKSQPS